MHPPDTRTRIYRFGPFELDAQTGELLRNGSRVRLGEQSCRVLTRLLQQPGELVSREELQQQLWGEGTFVDFDHGLNVVVGRLRQALSDTAEQPEYIETLPRKGYRFMSSVERVEFRPATIEPSHGEGLAAQQSRPVFRYPVRTFLMAAVAASLRHFSGSFGALKKHHS